MKRSTFFAAMGGIPFIMNACKADSSQNAESSQDAVVKLSREEIKARSFNELFKAIDAKELQEGVFTLLANEDSSALTSGTPSHYNTMIAGWGGMGILFNKPTVFHMLRSNRYTLELMRKENSYSMTFFDAEFKEDYMQFGMSSGRDSDDKMKNTKLTAIQTPTGNMTFKEAKLILECKLTQVTTVSPDDFLIEEDKTFVVDAYAEANDYHKMVFGEVTNVWICKLN